MENKDQGMMRKKRESKGRQKIDIKKIEKKDALQVTFSKRRTNLMKKASELCFLTGAEICMLAFSPGGKVYSFAPSNNKEAIIERFLHGSSNVEDNDNDGVSLVNSYLEDNLQELYCKLEAEKKRNEELRRREREPYSWWDAPIENMSLHELEKFEASLEDLKMKVGNRLMDESNSSSFGDASELHNPDEWVDYNDLFGTDEMTDPLVAVRPSEANMLIGGAGCNYDYENSFN